jgi:NAD-dependent deacetylase
MNVLILTGAGISAESGIPTFRGADGLWEGHRFEDVATPDGFQRNPKLVHRFYNERRAALQKPEIKPNAAHHALAEFESRWPDDFLLVTQNIDNLHQRAGSRNLLAMHGELLKARCVDTGELFDWTDELSVTTPHPHDPKRLGRLRPHVVWFGEMPIGLDQIQAAAETADVFVAIGTSAQVYPAAGIVKWTKPSCQRIEINLEATPASNQFHQALRGPASEVVPRFLATLI